MIVVSIECKSNFWVICLDVTIPSIFGKKKKKNYQECELIFLSYVKGKFLPSSGVDGDGRNKVWKFLRARGKLLFEARWPIIAGLNMARAGLIRPEFRRGVVTKPSPIQEVKNALKKLPPIWIANAFRSAYRTKQWLRSGIVVGCVGIHTDPPMCLHVQIPTLW